MIEASIRKKQGDFSLSAELSDGGFICLAGRNGSGKSTLFRVIAGQLKMDEGFVKVGGRDVTRQPVERRGIVMVTPGSSLPHLKVDSHLKWGAAIRGVPLDERVIAGTKAALGIDFGGSVRTLSLGMRERVSLATALLARPKVILVDEAFSNLHDREEFVANYRKLAGEAGVDVMFSTQDEDEGAGADHLYLIKQGVAERAK
ncbi:MAG: ATP-binding cassette domain-containing protein [Thaumarchaeota archaeon]|nr:ATP-binding cassette domain-containing protein [Nitrososphaerota archaeon]